MTKPNFLVIGAAKSGTTSLHHYLKQHPKIRMCKVRETHFFSAGGTPFQLQGPFERLTVQIVTNWKDYEKLFAGGEQFPAVGEVCPSYMQIPGTCRRIANALHGVRLIVILRHPTDRAYSDYQMRLGLGIDDLTFEEALEAEPKRIAGGWYGGDYLRKGFYGKQLVDFYATFPAHQIKAVLFEDLIQQPVELLNKICNFLRIESLADFVLEQHNRSGRIANPFLRLALERTNYIRGLVRPFLPNFVRQGVSNSINRARGKKIPMKAETRKRLDHLYRDDIMLCAELTGLDLAHWVDGSG